MEAADFSGYATKANLTCSDGRVITKDAFAHQDGLTVPLVWQHNHNDPTNILGKATLEHREDGVYCHAFFNDTEYGQQAKALVQHGDVVSLSIYANKLVEKGKEVFHGFIREVSLVLSGANPGALIDNVRIAHSDGDIETLDDAAYIYTGLPLVHSSSAKPDLKTLVVEDEEDKKDEEEFAHAEDSDETLEDVYNSFSEKQKNVVHYLVGIASEAADKNAETTEGGSAAQSSITSEDTGSDDTIAHKEGNDNMSRNLFDQNGQDAGAADGPTLSHSDLAAIQEKAQEIGSYKKAFLAHAATYGITDIEFLFPDAKNITSQPELLARRTEWVSTVLDAAKHSPFSRIKSIVADLTAEEARAKGYVKGNLKKDEIVKLLKRVTTPTTVYKKQKLDRDDIVDITELDVVAWLKWEMKFMLEEELARAILIGDGREVDHEDKIDEDHLRPIAYDDDMYAHKVTVPSNTTAEGYVEAIMRSRKFYKGTGTPTLFTTDDVLTDMLLIKNKIGSYVYDTEAALAAKLRVSKIVVVEVMEDTPDLLAILVNMTDYTIGADKGGQLAMFDDFDIDYNQQKYLIETRISGALTKPKAAVILRRSVGTVVTASAPTSDFATNKLTVPNVTGVTYYDVTNPLSEAALVDGEVYHLTATVDIEARAEAGYSFAHNVDTDWTFAYNSDGAANSAGDPTLPTA